MNEALLALLGAIFGGVGIKVFETFFLPKSAQIDIATKIRDELRKEITDLKSEIERLQKDLDDWKKKYYDLLDKYSGLNAKYVELLTKCDDLMEEIHDPKQ